MTRETPPSGKVNAELEDFIKKLLSDRPVAYHPMVAQAVGSVTAAIFLAQLLYWMPRSRNGWVYKTRDEMTRETALTRWEQEGARKVLRTAGVIEEQRRGVPPVMHFRVNYQRLAELLHGYHAPEPRGADPDEAPSADDAPVAAASDALPVPRARPPINRRKNLQLDGGSTSNQSAEKPPYISETTTETTTENFDDDDARKPKKRHDARSDQERGVPTLEVPLTGAAKRLHEFGVSAQAAVTLAATYPEEHILFELDLTRWLVETRSPLVERNPAGFLVRAIQGAFPAAPGYKSPAVRAAEEQRRNTVEQAEAARLRDAEAAYTRAKEQAQQRLREQHPPQLIPGTTMTTDGAWEQAVAALQDQVTGPIFQMWVKPTALLSCDGAAAVVAVRDRYHAEQLEERTFGLRLGHALGRIIDRSVTCQFVPMTELLRDEQDAPLLDAQATDSGQMTVYPTGGAGP